MHKITVSLGNIDEAIRQIEEYEKKVQQNVKKFVSKLVDEGVQIAKVKILTLPPKSAVESGDLLGSVKPVHVNDNKGFIVVDNDHAVFVEFGTGVVKNGSNGSHPMSDEFGLSIGTYGEGKGSNPDGWWYFDKKQNRKRFTEGMPSRPFMYETAKDLEHKIVEIAREVFSR